MPNQKPVRWRSVDRFGGYRPCSTTRRLPRFHQGPFDGRRGRVTSRGSHGSSPRTSRAFSWGLGPLAHGEAIQTAKGPPVSKFGEMLFFLPYGIPSKYRPEQGESRGQDIWYRYPEAGQLRLDGRHRFICEPSGSCFLQSALGAITEATSAQ